MESTIQNDGPSPEVRAEIVAYLLKDQSRLGETYRADQEQLTDEQIMERFGVQTNGILVKRRRVLRVLLEGRLPNGSQVVLNVERKLRNLLLQWEWSVDAVAYIAVLQARLLEQADDPEVRVRERKAAIEETAAVEALGKPGIYVYTLPHYLEHRFEPISGRTLLKVGHSGAAMIERFNNQTRTTALPEEPILLRVYPVSDEASSAALEKKFHALLRAADHDRPVTRSAGQEWFLTSRKFLDAIAELHGLPIHVVSTQFEDDE